MNNETAIHRDARGEAIEPALFERVIRISRHPHRWFHHLLLLTAGQARAMSSGVPSAVQAPSLLVFPPSDGEGITISAGAHGFLIGASPEIIGEAIGDHAESASLRLFSSGFAVADSIAATDIRELLPLFEGFIAELGQEGRASRMVAGAYMRLVLMKAWRLGGAEESSATMARTSGSILQRFRQSVEANFRAHWSISDYARELGITPDRLHAICQRNLSRPPIELVHDRLVQEAKLRLERAARSVQEISDSLGFRDPSNFSHFFKRKTGLSPARYRALASQAGAAAIPTSSGYYEWP